MRKLEAQSGPDRVHEPHIVAVAGPVRYRWSFDEHAEQTVRSSLSSVVVVPWRTTIEMLQERVCGMDSHKKSIQACVRRRAPGGSVVSEVRSFGTMTRELMRLADWLMAEGVTHVAMESTGVYWEPVYNIFEGRFEEILVVNAKHVKNVPGRKTDVKDSEWLAQLLQCGLLRGSLIPDRPRRELRELTRQRTQLVGQHTAVINRIHKTLEDANIKLACVASDVVGVSGRAMLRALLAGTSSPTQMAHLAIGKMQKNIPALEQALEGHVTEHHRFLLTELLDQMEDLERRIDRFSERIGELCRPFEAQIAAIDAIPGFDVRGAQNVIAEIGTDMSPFPTAGHLASWAGMCPGNHKTGGRSKSGKTTKGSRWLRTGLIQAAYGASKKKNSYYRSQYGRLSRKRGKKKAAVAVGHSLLTTIWHVLKTGRPYADLGVDYFDKLDEDRIVSYHLRRLRQLGHTVTVTKSDQAA